MPGSLGPSIVRDQELLLLHCVTFLKPYFQYSHSLRREELEFRGLMQNALLTAAFLSHHCPVGVVNARLLTGRKNSSRPLTSEVPYYVLLLSAILGTPIFKSIARDILI